jgi:hypothetical protein
VVLNGAFSMAKKDQKNEPIVHFLMDIPGTRLLVHQSLQED